MSAPFISVIVLNWNGKADTLACLRSLKEVEYPRWEIIVVDNGSSDGTAEAVRAEYPDAGLICLGENRRYAGGNNAGIRAAMEHGADAVLLLNNDTVVDKNFLTELTGALSAGANAGIAGPKIYYYADPKRIWYAGGRISWWGGWLRHDGIREPDNDRYGALKRTEYVSGCCLLIRREVIDRVGLLDESYFIYGEDADWCVRAARAGYSIWMAPSAHVWHKVSASSGQFTWFKQWNKLKSQLRLFRIHARWYHWITIPFGICWNYVRSAASVTAAATSRQ